MISRITKNIFTKNSELSKVSTLESLTHSIQEVEKYAPFEIVVVVDQSFSIGEIFSGVTARQKAELLFSLEKVWDTANNNGILYYVNLAEKLVEILPDRAFYGQEEVFKRALEVLVRNVSVEGFRESFVVLEKGLKVDFVKVRNEIKDGIKLI